MRESTKLVQSVDLSVLVHNGRNSCSSVPILFATLWHWLASQVLFCDNVVSGLFRLQSLQQLPDRRMIASNQLSHVVCSGCPGLAIAQST